MDLSWGGVRRGEPRENCRLWTAVVAEQDGSRWIDFAVSDRREGPLLRLYERLPEAERYSIALAYWYVRGGRCQFNTCTY